MAIYFQDGVPSAGSLKFVGGRASRKGLTCHDGLINCLRRPELGNDVEAGFHFFHRRKFLISVSSWCTLVVGEMAVK